MSRRLRARPCPPPPLASLAGDWLNPVQEESFALPVVHNFVGSVQASWGPTGIQNWVVPPTGLPTPTGQLYRLEDGRPLRVGPAGTSYRWTPWQIERRHTEVHSRVRLHWEGASVTERLTFHRSGRYTLTFGGLCRTWSFAHYWNLPPDDVPQLAVQHRDGAVLVGDIKTFGLARFTIDGPVVEIVGHRDRDDFYAGGPGADRGRLAAVVLEVEAGQEVSWTATQGTDERPEPVCDDRDVAERWEEAWQAVFSADDPTFSGHLPSVTFDDPELDRLHYVAVLSLLNGRRRIRRPSPRDRFATGGQAIWAAEATPLPVAWTTGATEGAATTSFIWELHLSAPLLARLDPAVLRHQLELFLDFDLRRHWGIDVHTGQPVGMWYAINDTAVIAAAADYLAGTGDHAWLDTELATGRVRELLLRHVFRHHDLAKGGPLADYGPAENLLECVSTYQHRVASFNAMAAWAYRYAARELAPERSTELMRRAETIEEAVLDLAQPDGVFRCGPAGAETPVRTALDFVYVGTYLGHRLDDEHRARMLRFFSSELETDDWMRALSRSDPDSLTAALPDFQSYRADHQSTGSYDAWPGMAAAVRLAFGDEDATLEWLRRISRLTREGPFGQAHWVGTGDAEPATKASFMNGNCYLEVCGSRFATTLLQWAGVLTAPTAP